MVRSDSPSTPLDTEAITARAEAATPGPWEAARGATPGGHYLATTKAEKAEFLRLALNDGAAELWLVDNTESIPAVTGDGPYAQANSEFIAHAREDIPALLREVERQAGLLAKANANAKDWYEESERAVDRSIALRERLRLVAEWRDENRAHEIYEATEHEPAECTDECAWCALDAILNDEGKTDG